MSEPSTPTADASRALQEADAVREQRALIPQLTEAHSRLQDAHAQLCAAEKALQGATRLHALQRTTAALGGQADELVRIIANTLQLMPPDPAGESPA